MKLFQDSPLDPIPENSIVRLSSFSSSPSSSVPVYRYIAFLRASFNCVLTSLERNLRALVDRKGKEALRNPRDRTEEGIAEVSCLSSARENPRAVKHPGQRAERRGQGEPRKRVLLYDARMHASAMKL